MDIKDFIDKKKKSGDELTVTVKIPKLEEGEKKVKITTADVLRVVKEEYDIVSYKKRIFLRQKEDEEVEDTCVFNLEPSKTTSKNTRGSSGSKTKSSKEDTE